MTLPVLETSPPQVWLYSFEPAGKVLLKTWKTASPESHLEEKWPGPWDALLTTPHRGEVGRNETLDSSPQSKERTGATMDCRTSRRPESHLSKTMTYILFTTFSLTLCYRELAPCTWDKNIWVHLAKNVLNVSEFCLAEGTYVEQTFTTPLKGVCTPLESLWNCTLLQHINRKRTYTDVYNWQPVVTPKDREIFSLKVTYVTPPREWATSVNCAKNYFVLYHSLWLHTMCPLIWLCN